MRVGLVNNMPDAAVGASESQFRRLLEAAAGDRRLDLVLFTLPEVERSAQMREQMEVHYRPAAEVADAALDALVVTGACPSAGPLRDEPIWPAFTRLVDVAETLGLPTLWSCFAAHAAVDHLDGVTRRKLPAKQSGVFCCTTTRDHPLLAGIDRTVHAPHSRWHDLAEADLLGRGYEVLTRSAVVGVDSFVRPGPAPFLFWQGHPEYDADTLAREYLRDLRHFVKGESPLAPSIPTGLFDAETEADWTRRTQAAIEKGQPLSLAPPQGVALERRWRGFGEQLLGNWLDAALGRGPAEAFAARA